MPTYIFGEGPTATVTGTHKDTYIDGSFATDDSFATEDNLQVNGGASVHALMRFDISSIPAGETISTAVLGLYLQIPPLLAPVTVSAYRLVTGWGKTDTDGGASQSPAADSQATWNEALAGPTNTKWAGGGAFTASDYAAGAIDSFVVSNLDAAGTLYSLDLVTPVTAWHTGTATNHGIVLIEGGDDIAQLDSQESATAAERPLLTVVTSGGGGGATGSSVARQKSSTSVGIGIGV